MTVEFARQHPHIAVSYVRPCIVGGPHMDNYLRRLLFQMPIIVLLDGVDSAIQLVHEDDASAAIVGGTAVSPDANESEHSQEHTDRERHR